MSPEQRLNVELDEAQSKAWDALSRYKFQMFGYWAAIWVHLNRISGQKRPNPWRDLVMTARNHEMLDKGETHAQPLSDL
jgi:hypothetical protein